jgi:hypothetical protein
MPDLLVRIKKNPDGTAVLSCVRADGSSTWQKQTGAKARYFPVHDLTHYAVETLLGHQRGFYGLLAEGWDISDFGTPWPRGPIPADADPSELIVGYLDTERATGVRMSADELNAQAEAFCAAHGQTGWRPLSDAELDAVRAKARELAGRWHALAPGETLELPFDRPTRS